MTPTAPRVTQRRLPTKSVRVNARSSERSIISDLSSYPGPPLVVTTTRGTVLQQHSLPLLSPHAPATAAKVDENTHAAIAAREIAKDTNGGDGGDSDEDGDEFELHGDYKEDLGQDRTGIYDFAEEAGTVKGLLDVTNSVGDILGNVTLYDQDEEDDVGIVNMDMSHVRVPRVPEDYVEPLVKHDRKEPMFEDVDNPGKWPRYCFQPGKA